MKGALDKLRAWLGDSERGLAASNFTWLVADKLVRFVIGVCVSFLVARHLGPDRLGTLGYAAAIAGMLVLLAEGGLEAIVRREIAADPENEARTLTAAALWRFAVGVLSYAAICAYALVSGRGESGAGLLPVLGLMVFQPAAMLPELWFQARLKSRVAVWSQWGAAFAGAVLRIALVVTAADVTAFAWATIFELALAAMLIAWRARAAGMAFSFAGGAGRRAWRLACEAWPLLLSGIAVAVYMRIDVVMLRNLTGERAVGLYMAGVKFGEVWLFMPGALAASLVPALARARRAGDTDYEAKVREYCRLSALLGYALAVPVFLIGPWLTRLAYGEGFAEAMPVQRVHAWVLLFACVGVARGQVCVLEGWTRFHLLATVTGALINIGLNFALIPAFGPVGAAWGTVAAQVIAAWVSTFFHAPARALAWTQTRALLYPWPDLRHER